MFIGLISVGREKCESDKIGVRTREALCAGAGATRARLVRGRGPEAADGQGSPPIARIAPQRPRIRRYTTSSLQKHDPLEHIINIREITT